MGEVDIDAALESEGGFAALEAQDAIWAFADNGEIGCATIHFELPAIGEPAGGSGGGVQDYESQGSAGDERGYRDKTNCGRKNKTGPQELPPLSILAAFEPVLV